MKKARHPQIKFYVGRAIGHFTDNGWVNKQNILYRKKTTAELRANLILQQEGQVYIRVCYGDKLDNDGIYKTHADLRQAFSSFTENPLVDYALEGK